MERIMSRIVLGLMLVYGLLAPAGIAQTPPATGLPPSQRAPQQGTSDALQPAGAAAVSVQDRIANSNSA